MAAVTSLVAVATAAPALATHHNECCALSAGRITCGVAGLMLLALVPSTLRGNMAFIPHFLAAPGLARIGIRIGRGAGFDAPESFQERRLSASVQGILGVLLLLSAASPWVLHTFDRWLLIGLAIVMITLMGGLSVLQGVLVLAAGIHERWAWHFVVPPAREPQDGPVAVPLNQHEDAVRGGFEGLGTAMLARVMPWWAAGVWHLILGVAVLAVVVMTIIEGELPNIAQFVLEFAGATAYILGGAAFVFMLVGTGGRTPESRFKTMLGLGLIFVIADALGAPHPPELVERLGERVGW